jgi:hypothetical protein
MNATRRATSVVVPSLPARIARSTRALACRFSRKRSFIGVAVNPGAMQLTRTPRGASSTASARVRPSSALFVAAYADWFAIPTRPELDDTNKTTDPCARTGSTA